MGNGKLMSIFCANEYQVQIFQNLRQYLAPKGKLLPESITNIIQLAHTEFEQGEKHYPVIFARHLPQQLSLQRIVNIIDLYAVQNLRVEKTIEIIPTLSGKVNCVFLHSFIQIAEGFNFTGTDSLMPPTVCQLTAPADVKKGQKIKLHISFEYGTSLDKAQFWIEN